MSFRLSYAIVVQTEFRHLGLVLPALGHENWDSVNGVLLPVLTDKLLQTQQNGFRIQQKWASRGAFGVCVPSYVLHMTLWASNARSPSIRIRLQNHSWLITALCCAVALAGSMILCYSQIAASDRQAQQSSPPNSFVGLFTSTDVQLVLNSGIDKMSGTLRFNGRIYAVEAVAEDLSARGVFKDGEDSWPFTIVKVTGGLEFRTGTFHCILMRQHRPNEASIEHPWSNSLGMKFVPMAGTKFLFCIHETRVADFAVFVSDAKFDYGNNNPPLTLTSEGWAFRSGFSWSNLGFAQSGEHPVTCVNWEDAQAFCKWLSMKDGYTYRLPTDHEWSQAVGIGDKEDKDLPPEEKSGKVLGVYPWGRQFPPINLVGNYAGVEVRALNLPSNFPLFEQYTDGFAHTSPVMRFRANERGIYDLGGNVFEMCEDWYNPKHEGHPARGGSWNYSAQFYLMSSTRCEVKSTTRSVDCGFRIVLSLDEVH
ncbi:MAG: SUMF1/EgtB/PvdO family nonheme iron enzyme [Verrucomicrobiaceae bacterium]